MKTFAIVLVAVLVGAGCGKDTGHRRADEITPVAMTVTEEPHLVAIGTDQRAVQGCIQNTSGNDAVNLIVECKIQDTFRFAPPILLTAERPSLLNGEEWCFETEAVAGSTNAHVTPIPTITFTPAP